MFGLRMFIFIYVLLAVDSLWMAKNGNIEEITKPENQTKNIRIDRTCFPSVPIIFLDECPPINLVCFKNRKTKTSTI